MLTIRRDEEIHDEQRGWFHSRWHFSFGGYRDPEQTGVGALRVFNDDQIIAGAQWPMHPHRDIESLTYVVEGCFEHADSLGNGGRLEEGAAQVMTFSSRGASHSERNGSEQDPMRFIQFWILPSEEGLDSAVQQRQFTVEERTDRWLQIMSPTGQDGLDLSQDARVKVTHLTAGSRLRHSFGEDRSGYVYVMDGRVILDDDKLAAGDAAKVGGPHDLHIAGADEATELILVDVPVEFTPVGVWAG